MCPLVAALIRERYCRSASSRSATTKPIFIASVRIQYCLKLAKNREHFTCTRGPLSVFRLSVHLLVPTCEITECWRLRAFKTHCSNSSKHMNFSQQCTEKQRACMWKKHMESEVWIKSKEQNRFSLREIFNWFYIFLIDKKNEYLFFYLSLLKVFISMDIRLFSMILQICNL